jgi:hypothetical protein
MPEIRYKITRPCQRIDHARGVCSRITRRAVSAVWSRGIGSTRAHRPRPCARGSEPRDCGCSHSRGARIERPAWVFDETNPHECAEFRSRGTSLTQENLVPYLRGERTCLQVIA